MGAGGELAAAQQPPLEDGEEDLLALIDQHDHGPLTGPAADEALRRLEELGEHQRLAGQVVTDPRRLLRLTTDNARLREELEAARSVSHLDTARAARKED
jgi:hypothetical protein